MPVPGPALRSAVRRWFERWNDVCAALGLFALGALIYLAGLRSLVGGEDVPLAARLLVLGVGSAGLLLRRRMPLVALGIVLVTLAVDVWWGISLSMVLVLGDALYAATLYGSRRVSRVMVGVAAATALSAAVTGIALGRDWRLAFLLALQIGVIPLVPVWWGMNVRQGRETAAAERIRAEQVARIADLDRRSAVAGERARLARDLHDIIAGHLSAIALQSEAVLSMGGGKDATDRDPATVWAVLRSIRENSVQSLAEMRAMIDLLRSEDGSVADGRAADRPDPTTAPARLRELGPLLESARAAGLRVEAAGARTGEDFPVAVDLAGYRIVQEALTNAVKHAPGSRACVTVTQDGHRLVVEVTNELTDELPSEAVANANANSGAGVGAGLASMRERAEAVGGSLSAGRNGGRWQVRAVLPVEPVEGAET